MTHNVYLSVQRGHGDDASAVLVRIDRLDGSLRDVALDDVPDRRRSQLADAPDADDDRSDITLPAEGEGEELKFGDRTIRILRRPIRTATVTDLAYVDGMRCSSPASRTRSSRRSCGASRSRSASERRGDNNLEIFHVSHGKWETAAPIRTFVPYDDGRSILASYTCTPVVHFPLDDVEPGTQDRGPHGRRARRR